VSKALIVIQCIGAQAVSFAAYGQGTGPILLDDVACAGTETRLIECRASPITTHNCLHAEDASVRCQAPPRKLNNIIVWGFPPFFPIAFPKPCTKFCGVCS
jgi:hypothetical protein